MSRFKAAIHLSDWARQQIAALPPDPQFDEEHAAEMLARTAAIRRRVEAEMVAEEVATIGLLRKHKRKVKR
jgi:hypothetical protein